MFCISKKSVLTLVAALGLGVIGAANVASANSIKFGDDKKDKKHDEIKLCDDIRTEKDKHEIKGSSDKDCPSLLDCRDDRHDNRHDEDAKDCKDKKDKKDGKFGDEKDCDKKVKFDDSDKLCRDDRKDCGKDWKPAEHCEKHDDCREAPKCHDHCKDDCHPTSIPIPAAAGMFPFGAAVAGIAMKRMKKLL